jgi:hypothetical protein
MSQTQSSVKTGPLSPADLGQFSFRDGVWYLSPSPLTIKQPTVK